MQKDKQNFRHLKTKLGTFWILEQGLNHKAHLGLNDDELSEFDSSEEAAKAVFNQKTGEYLWDCQSKIEAPDSINKWSNGQPDKW